MNLIKVIVCLPRIIVNWSFGVRRTRPFPAEMGAPSTEKAIESGTRLYNSQGENPPSPGLCGRSVAHNKGSEVRTGPTGRRSFIGNYLLDRRTCGMGKQVWRFGLAAMAIGMGCSSGSLFAPVGVLGRFGGGGAVIARSMPVAENRPGTQGRAIEETLGRADGYFLTQYYHKRYNPLQKRVNNANCGPTSLAMALLAFGKAPPELAGPERACQLIRNVRQVMTGSSDESTWTYPVQVADGARRLGLQSKVIFTLPRIREAMAVSGRLMVVNVNPSPSYVENLVYPYNGGHFALLTGIDGDRVYLSDPLATGPLVLSISQLELALTTPLGNDPDGRFVPPFNGGVLIWQ